MAVDQAEVQQKLDDGDTLSKEEQRFAQDRGILPDSYDTQPVTFQSLEQTVSNDPIAVLQNVQEQRVNDLEAEVERRVAEELARRVAPELQHEQIVAATPHTGDAGTAVHRTPIDKSLFDSSDEDEDDDDEDGEEDYDEGWNNDSRRAELTKRGLPTDGNKDELIARLVESDNKED
jgi:hypothetical protein